MQPYPIINTEKSDLDFIYHLFDEAIVYQKKNNFPVWPDYDKEVLKNDIENKLQYKIIMDGNIACIFTICFADKIVWREKDKGNVIYLHRIVVNPNYKGQQQFGKIMEWALKYTKEKELRFIRMDTWADNPTLIDYYLSFGFNIVGYFTTPDSDEVPIQQRGNDVVLLEFKL